VFERLRFKTAAGVGGVSIGGPPGWVGGQVAFAGNHLVDPPGYELTQTHAGSWVQGGEVVVIPWCREETGPFCEEGLSKPLLQGGVAVIHHGSWRGVGGWRDEVRIDHAHP